MSLRLPGNPNGARVKVDLCVLKQLQPKYFIVVNAKNTNKNKKKQNFINTYTGITFLHYKLEELLLNL